MPQNQNAGSFPDTLTQNNYQWLEKEFLKYADNGNYEGIYEFSEKAGLQMDWGKYDYSVPEKRQEPDMEMLFNAINKFNQEFVGRYVAFGELSDKYNIVNILDLQQLSNNRCFLGELKTRSNYIPYITALELIEKSSLKKTDQTNQ